MLRQLGSLEHNLIEEGKRYVFWRLLEHHEVEDLLPNYVRNGKLFEANKGMLESMKLAYNTLVGTRQSQHLTFKNVLLSYVVFNNVNFSQRHIASLGASRYYVKNTVVKWIHVDQNKENSRGDALEKMK
jgi:hypothetical protein